MTELNYKSRLYFLMCFLFSISLYGQNDWKLEADKDGIIIYSRDSELSDFNEFKAETVIEESVHSFIAVLKDIDRIPDWMHSVEYSRLLELQADSVQIYYTQADAPFPVKSRDGIYLNRFNWDNENKTLRVDIEVIGDYLEEDDDFVRIAVGNGFWLAQEENNGKLKLTFQMQVDPGGAIPSWLANMFVVDTPFKTISKLRDIITDEKYDNIEYEFID